MSLKTRQDGKLAFVKRAGFVDEIGRYRCPSRDSSATPVRPQKRGEAIADSVNNLATAKVTRGKATALSRLVRFTFDDLHGQGCRKGRASHCDVEYHFVIAAWRAKKGRIRRVKYWEIIARNIKKRGWSLGYVSALIPTGERSGLQTHIAEMKSVSCYVRMKY